MSQKLQLVLYKHDRIQYFSIDMFCMNLMNMIFYIKQIFYGSFSNMKYNTTLQHLQYWLLHHNCHCVISCTTLWKNLQLTSDEFDELNFSFFTWQTEQLSEVPFINGDPALI